jgi:hypothetical protein
MWIVAMLFVPVARVLSADVVATKIKTKAFDFTNSKEERFMS